MNLDWTLPLYLIVSILSYWVVEGNARGTGIGDILSLEWEDFGTLGKVGNNHQDASKPSTDGVNGKSPTNTPLTNKSSTIYTLARRDNVNHDANPTITISMLHLLGTISKKWPEQSWSRIKMNFNQTYLLLHMMILPFLIQGGGNNSAFYTESRAEPYPTTSIESNVSTTQNDASTESLSPSEIDKFANSEKVRLKGNT